MFFASRKPPAAASAKTLLLSRRKAPDGVVRRIRQSLVDAFFPPRCAGCERFGEELFCYACAPKLQKIPAPFCACCGAPFDPLAFSAEICAVCRLRPPHYVAARSAFVFEGPMRTAIHDFKYRRFFDDARRLAPLLAREIRGDPTFQKQRFDFLVPVPLHRQRERARGFNQSVLLARALSEQCEIPALEALIRTQKTAPQVGLNAQQRRQNVRGAITVSPQTAPETLRGARVLLVDDVFTTGATMDECAKILRRAQVAEVFALTLARQLAPDEKGFAQMALHEAWI